MTASRRSRGFSLIELMVGVAIGLVRFLSARRVTLFSARSRDSVRR